jgi:hypothetical protein
VSRQALVQAQLDAYNAQDVDALVGFFSDDIVTAEFNGAVMGQGLAAYRARQADLFAQHPQNRAELVSRMVVGDTVIDQERVLRSPDAAPLDVAVIYSFAGDKIARMDFVRG